jgi:hypothetical protein
MEETESVKVQGAKRPVTKIYRKINSREVECGNRSESDYESFDYTFVKSQTVETVFTDLGTLRRSASIRESSRSRINLFAKRTGSFRNDFDRQI